MHLGRFNITVDGVTKVVAIFALLLFVSSVFKGVSTLEVATIKTTNTTTTETTEQTPINKEQLNNPTTSNTLKGASKKVITLKLNPNRVVFVTGEIRENALDIARSITELSSNPNEPIYLIINSPGGSVLDGATIISAMQASKSPVYTVCVQLCASMAALIHQYGTKRLALDKAILMFHPASGGAEGELDKMVSRLGMIQQFIAKMENNVANRAHMTLEQYKNKANIEWWVEADDGLSVGLVDNLVSVEAKHASLLYGTLSNRSKKIPFYVPTPPAGNGESGNNSGELEKFNIVPAPRPKTAITF